MAKLNTLVKNQVKESLGVSDEELEYLRHPAPEHLHDPFGYKGMRELVGCLHALKLRQEKDESLLLIVRSDYDTDGVCASACLSAALDAFGFAYRMFVPTMDDGYGFKPKDVDRMKAENEIQGYKIAMILTADNGISSYAAVKYAKEQGIDVLITDHHPGKGGRLYLAKAVVDANQPDDLYPFKGNSGACVAWKAMLAYASMYDREKMPLIERLIVFAGISNVADVMPMRGENRYMVKAALKILNEIMRAADYKKIADTPYTAYNAAFHGLYDLMVMFKEHKDAQRMKRRKKPVPLALNEELIGWYLSPLLNAPRRVHDTCLEAMAALLVSDVKTRRCAIERLIALNEEKSKLRDDVLNALPPGRAEPVICANTRKGISGLIAGKLAEGSPFPSIVFSRLDEKYPDAIYVSPPADGKLTASARSNERVPLDRLMKMVNQEWAGTHPGQNPLISGGGHATSAGMTIDARNYSEFRELIRKNIACLYAETADEIKSLVENRITLTVGENKLTAQFPAIRDGRLAVYAAEVDIDTFADDAREAVEWLESLRPFGEGCMAETQIAVVFGSSVKGRRWNPNFWETFKFDLYGVEVLTWDISWARQVKAALGSGELQRKPVTGIGKLKLNYYHGYVTPQLVIGPA